jgi:hypothetical protein
MLRLGVDVQLVVVTIDPRTEAWVRRIDGVGPSMRLVPRVIGPSSIPAITDIDEARADPELAVLSALAHAHRPPEGVVPIAWAALVGAAGLDDPAGAIYADLVRAGLGPLARAALEEFMANPSTYEFQSDFAKKYVQIGREAGREEGREEGLEKGLERGLEQGLGVLRRVLIHAIAARGLELSAGDRERIEACRDSARLEAWMERVLAASSVDEVLA